MIRHPRYTLEEIAPLLEGALRAKGNQFFRLTKDGKCEQYGLKKRLVQELGMEPAAAAALLRLADIPTGDFIRNRKKPKSTGPLPDCVTVINAAVQQYHQGDEVKELEEEQEVEEVAGSEQVPAAPVKPQPPTEEEILAKAEAAESKADKHRFQFIQTSSRHGVKHAIWDSHEGTTVYMAYTFAECQEEMGRLRAGKSAFEWPIQARHARAEFRD